MANPCEVLVDTDQPGFQPQEIHHKLGLRGSDTAAISLDDVEASDEAILGEDIDKRNFRRKITQKGIVRPLKEWTEGTGRRPGQLYQFAPGAKHGSNGPHRR